MKNISSYVLWVLMAISAGMLVYFGAIAPSEAVFDSTGKTIMCSTGLDVYLYWTEAIVVIALAALVVFALINFKNDVKAALAGLFGILAVVALLAVCFFLSDGQELVRIVNGETEVITENWMKIIDMWCYSIYALIGLTIVLVVGFPILRAIKVIK